MLNNKIKNILLIKDMSPSRFADEIGVQRSSISHILSGRNKPSLEIVQRIIKRFPELGMDWIIEDETTDEEEAKEKNEEKPNPGLLTNKQQETTSQEITEQVPTITKRTIEKILIFYSDKTFTEYNPG